MNTAHKITLSICLGLIIILASQALAIMPPPPTEWYQQRLKMPIPEGYGKVFPTIPPEWNESLRVAAEKRPNNTDNLLIILVEFPDHYAEQWSHPWEAYQDLMFSEGVIPTGSLREYYEEVSYGAFSPAGTTTVWIMAPHDYSYYANGNGLGDYPHNSQGLLEDCVNILDPDLDFSQFDNNGDGYADAISLVHAGPGAEETGYYMDIWSHAGSYEVLTDDGVSTGRYSVEPEEFMDGSMIAIGVFCHEYGHVLGLPDLYDGDKTSEGIGVYCLMSGGSWGALPFTPERPTHLCAEMKMRLGWITPTKVTGNLYDLYIPPVETNPVCYKISHPSDTGQYFLIENRAKVGFDSLFRGDGGLAIWHVDLSRKYYQHDETHPYIALEQADGNYDLMRDVGGGNNDPHTNRGDAGDLYPGATANTWFSFSSSPSSYDYNGTTAFATIEDIIQNGDSMIVSVLPDPSNPIYRFHGFAIDDDVEGYPSDFDHEADSGEAADVVVTLACDGAGSPNLIGTVTTTDPRVTILDSEADFAPSTHDDLTSNEASPFQVAVESADADSAVTFTLHLEADNGAVDVPFRMNINRPKVLVVLDNNNSHWSDNLVEAMHATGYSFDTLYSYPSTRITYDDLIPYHAILWTTASYFGKRNSYYIPDLEYCLTSGEIAVLQQYLDNNGRMGLFSQHYLYDVGYNSFTADYLHLSSAIQNIGSSPSLTGMTGPFVTGSDYFFKEWSYYDYTDRMLSHVGAPVLVKDEGMGSDVMIGYPATPQIGSYATTMATFGVERLDDSSLTRLLTAWCEWILTNTNIDVPITTMPPDGDTNSESPAMFMWKASPGAVSYTIQVATDFEFTNIIRETTVPSNSTAFAQPFEDGTYYWRVKASPDSKIATAFSPRAQFTVETPVLYLCGDASGDDAVNISDAVYLISYIFKGGPAPDPLCLGDTDGDDAVNIADAVYLINYIFKGGLPPTEPCCP